MTTRTSHARPDSIITPENITTECTFNAMQLQRLTGFPDPFRAIAELGQTWHVVRDDLGMIVRMMDYSPSVLPGAFFRHNDGHYILETRREYGTVAHWRDGAHVVTNVHALTVSYVVAVRMASPDGGQPTLRNVAPMLHQATPTCGPDDRLHTVTRVPGMTAAHVTCLRCQLEKSIRRAFFR